MLETWFRRYTFETFQAAMSFSIAVNVFCDILLFQSSNPNKGSIMKDEKFFHENILNILLSTLPLFHVTWDCL